MQIVNGAIIKNPLNWLIVILMVLIGVLGLELITSAFKGTWNCGCDS